MSSRASYCRLVILVAATSLLAGAGFAVMLWGGTLFGEGPCEVYSDSSPQRAFCALARQHKPAHLAAYIRGRSTCEWKHLPARAPRGRADIDEEPVRAAEEQPEEAAAGVPLRRSRPRQVDVVPPRPVRHDRRLRLERVGPRRDARGAGRRRVDRRRRLVRGRRRGDDHGLAAPRAPHPHDGGEVQLRDVRPQGGLHDGDAHRRRVRGEPRWCRLPVRSCPPPSSPATHAPPSLSSPLPIQLNIYPDGYGMEFSTPPTTSGTINDAPDQLDDHAVCSRWRCAGGRTAGHAVRAAEHHRADAHRRDPRAVAHNAMWYSVKFKQGAPCGVAPHPLAHRRGSAARLTASPRHARLPSRLAYPQASSST